MKLLIDLGNTRLKWALHEQGQLGPGHALSHANEHLPSLLDQVWQNLPDPESVQLASVVSAFKRQELEAWLNDRWQCPVHLVTSQAEQRGVRNGYEQPTQLGVDRWLAMIGAWVRFQGAVCVADCGSALTVDILDRQGQHLGGVIAPGLRLMGQALEAGTDLSLSEASLPTLLGRNTHSAIAAGRLQALQGLIDRCHRQLPEAHIVLTGGDAEQIAAGLNGPYELLPDLVLEGLADTLHGV